MAIDRQAKDKDKQLELKFPEKEVDIDKQRDHTDKCKQDSEVKHVINK